MDETQYLKDRLENQIDWYDRRSVQNQKWFKRLQVISIIAATSIPFLTGYITEATVTLKIITGFLGLFVAAITAVLGLYKFQEHWLEYRTTCESLKHEKYLFLTRTDPYNVEQAFPLLVQRIESLISKENTNWSQYMNKPAETEK